MRVVVAAVGRLKRGPEMELAERYRERAVKSGRGIGLRSLDVVEIAESRARDAQSFGVRGGRVLIWPWSNGDSDVGEICCVRSQTTPYPTVASARLRDPT